MAIDMEKLQDLLFEKLKGIEKDDECALVRIWNEYVDNTGHGAAIYYMSDFNDNEDWLKRQDPDDIVETVHDKFSEFDPSDSYYVKDSGDFESFSNLDHIVDYEELIDAFIGGEFSHCMIDLNSLKAKCVEKEYRPLNTAAELRNLFKDCTDKAVYVRGMGWTNGNDYMWLRLNSYGIRDGVLTFSLGNMCMTAREWFEKYVFSFTGAINDYQRFGVELRAEED